MDNKIKLNILEITYDENLSKGYILVLGEQQGKRRIPIIIGEMEAQAIALQIERISPPRPLTHDLFFQCAKAFGIEILEANIVRFEEGVFYAELLCFNGDREVVIDSRTSDAIALALRFRCPIFTNEEVMAKAGIMLEDDEEATTENGYGKSFIQNNIDELDGMLKDAIQNENYELASKIRDEIKRRSTDAPTTSTEP